MKYLIKICYPADHKLTPLELDECERIVYNTIREMLGTDVSVHITYPSSDDIEAKRVCYIFNVRVDYSNYLCSQDVFTWMANELPISVVQVSDMSKLLIGDFKCGWYNEGTTSYSPDSMHVDCRYAWHFNGEKTDYEVIDVEDYCRKLPEDRKKKYDGIKYVWSSTTSWDNPLKADNLEDALVEFEDYYYKMLWRSIESYQEKLTKATDNFRVMAEYKGYRMCNRRTNV